MNVPPDAPPSDWLADLDHTGDYGFRITAPTRSLLFERAAEALFRYTTDLSAVRPTGEEEIRIEAPGLTTLLQRWLSELNFRHASHGRQYATFRVNAITDTSLAATVSGEPYDPDRHSIYTEIKAITYHQLLVVREEDGWSATVILDL